ncbi:TetR family transcriptional regulator [Flavobacterium noncentrifugens]|uniref:Transcriptional regulator, TetR family n=1 Tax=Flavobacterium noncentrifugens TaxID=1128970 RepID=A0A1G8YMV6_9FLAO|nr:TetR/AcrR family transcriptional regulator [Flavobacterium noncentrifugens]GEP51287.1 TetR family transcriptional regulator [Flavobacterium noncentrifugens]SDK04073.1 transcriptional regulator, TetR family [Flavobacterium noncentrifugens]
MDKQKEILAAALKLFVEFGFHGTPTSKIAKEAGVANGTLFHYYPTKDDLITSLYVSIKLEMSAFVETQSPKNHDYKAQFKNQFVNALHWAMAHPNEFQYVQQFYNSPYAALLQSEILQEQMQKTCGEIQLAIDSGIVKRLPVDYIFTLLSSHLFGLNQYLKNANLPVSKQKVVITETFELLWDMLT